jgi:hypothetical protein
MNWKACGRNVSSLSINTSGETEKSTADSSAPYGVASQYSLGVTKESHEVQNSILSEILPG